MVRATITKKKILEALKVLSPKDRDEIIADARGRMLTEAYPLWRAMRRLGRI